MYKDNKPENSTHAVRRVSPLKVFGAVFLAVGLAASPAFGGTLTGSSGNGWHALAISPAATGTFIATYDATPSISPENAVVGLSSGAATGFGNLGCIARFNPSGIIDAYNGTGYGTSTVPYSAGVLYHFRFVVNVTAHTYSVYVTPAGGTELPVGTNYAFRSTANTMTSLNDWDLYVDPSIGGASLTAINLAVFPYFTSTYIGQAIRTVTDYAVEHPSTDSSNTKALPYTWVRATLADALAQAYLVTGDTHYLNSVNVWAEGTRSETYWLNGVRTATTSPAPAPSAGIDVWEAASRSALPTNDPHWFLPGTTTYMDVQYHADDSCAGHAFLQLYDLDPNPATDRYKIGKIAGIQRRIDYVISNPNGLPGRKIWWWADALFMAPPNFAHLAKITGDPKYAAALDSMYWDTYAYLFSPADNLFFRDDKYFPGQPLGSTKNGKNVIWSRGNGWVMAGLVEILTYLPPTDPKYASYVTLFQNMAAAIKARQQPSGLWHTSLDDPNDGYPGAGFKVGEVDGDETSGTVFFVYALSWGIQNGLLPGGSNGYEDVVKNAWMGLQTKIQPNGSLGYAQVVGQVAGPVTATNTTDFAAGGFALAGLEIMQLYGNQ